MSTVQRGPATGRWWRPPWRLMLGTALGYAAGAQLAWTFLAAAEASAVFYAAAGVTSAALVLSRPSHWPWVLLTVAAVEFTIDVAHGWPPGPAAAFALANTAEPLVGVLLLRRFVTGLDLTRKRHVAAFVGCCVVAGPLVGALVGATTISASGTVDWVHAFFPFWAGDALGVLTVGSAILAWRTRRGPAPGWRDLVWKAAAAATTVAATVVGFWPLVVPVLFLPLPVLFWVAVRRGLPALTVCGVALAVTANTMSAAGRGPWRGLSDSPQVAAATLQLFIAVAVLGAWALAVAASDRERARVRSMSESAARRQVQALQNVTARLAGAATAAEIGELIAHEGVALVATNGVAGIVTADGGHLRTWTTPGFPDEWAERFALLPFSARVQLTDAIRRGAPAVVQSRAEIAEHYPEAAATYDRTGVHSAVAVPVLLNGAAVGALAFGFPAENAVDADKIAYAESLAALTAQALDRARLYEREHEAAHQIQAALLPVLPNRLAGATAAGAYRPSEAANEVGGDWYDAFELDDGRIAFAVGDVVGHDLRAAVTMGRLQAAVRMMARTHDAPDAVLRGLDRATADIAGAFCTSLGYGDYDPRTRTLRYARAGHLPPLLMTAGEVCFLNGGRGTPLGVRSRRGRHHAGVHVPAGAMLVWYTDGLIERRGENLDAGLERLAEAAGRVRAAGVAADVRDHLIATLAPDGPPADDVAVLCLHLP